METSAEGATQPRLKGEALRNLGKATRPVVISMTGQPATYRRDHFAEKRKALTPVSVVAGQALHQGGAVLARAVEWLTPTSAPETRPVVKTSWIKSRKKEDELAQLAEAARYSTILNRFEAVAPLNDEERALLRRIGFAQRRVHQAGSDIVFEGEQPAPTLVVSGWASRTRVLSNGRRQILGLLLPGDGVGLCRDLEPASNASVTAITTVETVDASALFEAVRNPQRYPGIVLAMERISAQETAFADNQILRLGALPAARRLAHLLLELQWRLREVQLGNDRAFPLPLTHETIADMLGMGAVEVRRALRALRQRRMFDLRYGRVSMLSKKQPDLAGDFRPPELVARAGRRPFSVH